MKLISKLSVCPEPFAGYMTLETQIKMNFSEKAMHGATLCRNKNNRLICPTELDLLIFKAELEWTTTWLIYVCLWIWQKKIGKANEKESHFSSFYPSIWQTEIGSAHKIPQVPQTFFFFFFDFLSLSHHWAFH